MVWDLTQVLTEVVSDVKKINYISLCYFYYSDEVCDDELERNCLF